MNDSNTWNLTSLFKNDQDPAINEEKQQLQAAADNFVDKWDDRTDWLENAGILKELLEDYNSWLTNSGYYGKVGFYFFLRTSQDSQNPDLKAAQNQIDELSTKISNQMQFVELRLATINPKKQAEFLASSELSKFRHFLERIFAASKHLLSESEEKIVSLLSFHKSKWSDMLEEFLSGESVEMEDPKSKFTTQIDPVQNWPTKNSFLQSPQIQIKVLLIDAIGCLITKDASKNLSLNQELFDYLQTRKERKIVVTNAKGETLKKIKKLVNKPGFEIFTLEFEPDKTKPEYFEILLKNLKLKAENCFYLDHLTENLESAKKSGIEGILYENNPQIIGVFNYGLENVIKYRPSTKKSIKAVLFDIDGVLVQNYFDGQKNFANSLYFAKNYGITSAQTQEFYQKHFEACVLGKTDVKKVLSEFLPKWNWPKSVDEYVSEWIEADNQFYEQNLVLAKELKSQGFKIFIATNQEKYKTEWLKQNFGTSFDGIFSSFDLGFVKSNPEFWQTVQKNLNLEFGEILLIDDTEKNIKTAQSLGIKTILFDENKDDLVDLLKSKASIEVATKPKLQILTFEELMTKLSDSDQATRDLAAVKFNQVLKKYEKVAEHELNAILQHKKVMDELRSYQRPDSARLASDDITPDVVDILLESVQSQFQIANDYYKLKAKLLGKDKLEYHERNVEYGKVVQTYTFEQGVEILRRVFARLDGQKKNQSNSFSAILEDYLANGKIDVFPRVGKRGGAFMTGSVGRQIDPTFIFLNWTGTLNDVQTFAHEMGHACNYEMMKATSTALDWEASHLTAESPSTFMEDFVLEDILANSSSKKEKLAILMKKLNDDISSIFRQISLYLFELELHKEFRKVGYLSSTEIGKLFQKHMSNYMGDSVAKSEGAQNWWIYWSHIRMMFYVYSYGAGLLISKFMQSQLKADKQFITQIKKFYASGLSQTPVAILQQTLGIDATKPEIWQKGLLQTAENLKLATELAEELELVK